MSEATLRVIPGREGSWLWPPEDLGSKGLEGSSSICVGKQGILRRGGNEISVSFTTESKVAGSWLLGDGDSACGGRETVKEPLPFPLQLPFSLESGKEYPKV